MSRIDGLCNYCGVKPRLGRIQEGAIVRAAYWCPSCDRLAFGGDSYVKCHPKALAELLPIIHVDRQGKLL